jgi:hypothetical protein
MNMAQCDSQEAPCLTYSHPEFDHVCQAELVDKVSVKAISNDSMFSTSIGLDEIEAQNDCLESAEYLAGMKRKTGLYQLWVNTDFCIDHNEFLMQGIYVGPHFSLCDLSSRIKQQWPDADRLYISFYECEKRIVAYLNQLFLETYDFYLHQDENTGQKPLYTRWDYERFNFGTALFDEGEAFGSTPGYV